MELVESSVGMSNSREVSLKGCKDKLQKPLFQSSYKLQPIKNLCLDEKGETKRSLAIDAGQPSLLGENHISP